MLTIKVEGCALQFFDTAPSPNAYVPIANVNSFSGPSGSRSVLDITTLSDTAKVKATGIAEMGQVTFNFHFDATDTVLVDIWDKFLDGTSSLFRLVFSDSPETTFTFTAFVLSFNFDGSTDDVVRGSATLEITGTVADNLS